MSKSQGGRVKCKLPRPKSEFRMAGQFQISQRLCRLNLAVHGLEGIIKHGRTGRLDLVPANPPFNPAPCGTVDTAMCVSACRPSEGQLQDLPERQDHERLKDMVGPGRRFPFGVPRTDNSNYLWIQLFDSAQFPCPTPAALVMRALDGRGSGEVLLQKPWKWSPMYEWPS